MSSRFKELIISNTEVKPDGFAINIEKDRALFDEEIKKMGIKNAYRFMADTVCELYLNKYHEEFLFSNECIAYEIEYHTDAFMSALGYKGYIRNVTTMLFTKDELIEHCRIIDISTEDISDFKQATMFNYRNGIRNCYKNTVKDPFFNK